MNQALIHAAIGGCLIGVAITTSAVAWAKQRQETYLFGADFIPYGCRTLRTIALIGRNGLPSHEALVIVCPPSVLDELEGGRRLVP